MKQMTQRENTIKSFSCSFIVNVESFLVSCLTVRWKLGNNKSSRREDMNIASYVEMLELPPSCLYFTTNFLKQYRNARDYH